MPIKDRGGLWFTIDIYRTGRLRAHYLWFATTDLLQISADLSRAL